MPNGRLFHLANTIIIAAGEKEDLYESQFALCYNLTIKNVIYQYSVSHNAYLYCSDASMSKLWTPL